MKKVIFIMTVALGLVACGDSSSSKSGEAENVAEATESSVSLTVNPDESNVQWFGEKITGWSHTGTIDIKEGSISVEEGTIVSGQFVLDMNSIVEINSQMPEEKQTDLIMHLKGSDFFSADEFPTASFEISSATADSLTGNLTIKGISRSITIPYSHSMENGTMSANSSFVIDRSEWDVRYGSGSFFDDLGDDLIKDEISFDISLVANSNVMASDM